MTHESPSRSSSLRLRLREHSAILVFGDLLIAVISLMASLYLWASRDDWFDFSWSFLQQRVPAWFYLLPLLWLVMMVDLYDPHRAGSWRRVLRGVALAAFSGLLFYALLYFTSSPGSLPRRGVATFLLSASLLTLLWRALYIRLYTNPELMRRVLIVGAGRAGQTIAEVYRELWPPPFRLLGFIDDDLQKIGTQVAGFPVLAGSTGLLDLVERENVSDLIIAISGELQGATFQTILDCQERGVEVGRMQRLYEELLGRVPIHHLESEWVIRAFVDDVHVSGLYELGKRVMDLLGGLVGLGLTAMIFPFAAFATLVDSGLPIFYSQKRMGRGGSEFTIHKFRTMRQDAEKDGQARFAEENDPRITRVGNFLRRTRIDELPQFLNVVRGEMSLVGPRAERGDWVAHFERRIPFYRARLLVKPGITGWAQINYGYVSTVEDTSVKLEYDLYYIKHRSLLMDIVIILRTVGTVLGFKGR